MGEVLGISWLNTVIPPMLAYMPYMDPMGMDIYIYG